jgi:hypothetical protein
MQFDRISLWRRTKSTIIVLFVVLDSSRDRPILLRPWATHFSHKINVMKKCSLRAFQWMVKPLAGDIYLIKQSPIAKKPATLCYIQELR